MEWTCISSWTLTAYICPGEEEEVSLTKEKVKWLMPPGVRGTAVSESDDYEGDDSDDELEEDEEEALIRRNRRRGRSSQRRSARQARRRSPSDPPVSHYRCPRKLFLLALRMLTLRWPIDHFRRLLHPCTQILVYFSRVCRCSHGLSIYPPHYVNALTHSACKAL